MSKLDELKASYGVNAEIPGPVDKKAVAPGQGGNNAEGSRHAQGSSNLATPGQGGISDAHATTSNSNPGAEKKKVAQGSSNLSTPGQTMTQEEDEYEDLDDDMEEITEIQGITRDDIDVSEDVAAMFSGSDLSEDFVGRATEIFETAVVTKVNEKLEEILEQIQLDNEAALQEAHEELSAKVDEYLDYVVEQWMEENQLAVEMGLKSQMAEEFMSRLHDVFVESYIDVPESKVDVVEELACRVEELEASLNEEIAKNVALKSEVGSFEREVSFAEVTEGLTETQIAKLESLAEAVQFDSAEGFKDKLMTLRESYFPGRASSQTLSEEYSLDSEPVELDEEAGIIVDPVMKSYMSSISRSVKK